ncbi:alpha/beta-hydrolase [Xylona heveae TC161]|uniref:Carboxypeptidase n=1 Tax=Xylona heveae (strain CBS 132557 / TC161) TaxID=1328760 RepID=A0A164ZGK5_XYLHT|nr:alpha/beta-hydrolase [Xylona heveae TC161]KZF19080.1 alpha/beta-hydrolase [Xylona heveae TC161]
MRALSFLLVLALAVLTSARSSQHVGKKLERPAPRDNIFAERSQQQPVKRSAEHKKKQSYLNSKSSKFVVNGSAIPEVDFDVGESYAGLLPISDHANETSKLWFWFFPSENELAGDEILIWLNGGPGCSSLEGLLQENGPFLWQWGTFKPVPNPWTWVNLTNVVWIDQPVGTGFSQGTPTATSEADVAEQFLGFWKHFVKTFDLEKRKVYITGESYAGMYVPYIADAMLNKNDTKYYNLESIMIYDPSISSDVVTEEIPAVAFVDNWPGLFSLNSTFMDDIHDRADACGYTSFLNEYLVYPPKGPLPSPPNNTVTASCDLWDDIYYAASEINPCFNVYQIATTCPLLWDVMGFPGSFGYVPDGAFIYFNRTDVQKAINAPIGEYEECSSINVFVNGTDLSDPPALNGVLASVIERTNKTIIGHGAIDYVLLSNGTLLAIQNMTWNGAQGFSEEPQDEFYVPYHDDPSLSTLAGAGVFGRYRTERGLTFAEVSLSGHMIPQFAPSAAYRLLEFMLGRIDDLSQTSDFTTQSGNYTGNFSLPG